jgi:hypothetical protein
MKRESLVMEAILWNTKIFGRQPTTDKYVPIKAANRYP